MFSLDIYVAIVYIEFMYFNYSFKRVFDFN